MFVLICVVGVVGFVYAGILFVLISPICNRVPPRWKRPAAIVGVVLGLVPAGFGLHHFVLQPMAEWSSQIKPFRGHLAEYANLAAYPQIAGPLQRPSGKIIVVDIPGENVDPVLADLPAGIRASTPSEVGTVALLSWSREQVGTYGDYGRAYRVNCDMKVYDKTTGRLVDHESFAGGPPPERSENGTDREGGSPSGEIVDSIVALYNRP